MSQGFGDFHSHLIPGVDDGARDLEDSLGAVARMVGEGIGRIITTPHIQASLAGEPERFKAVMSQMDQAWKLVQRAVAERHPKLDFRRGCEVMLDIPDGDLSDPRLHLGGTRFILVEWPRLHVPPGTVEVVHRICASGLRPVIAHPERYVGVDASLDILFRWKEAGALLQGNYGSFVGRYGSTAQKLIVRMVEEGALDYLSSDFHARSHLKVYATEGQAALADLGGQQQVELLASVNPARLFNGEEPMPVPPVLIERGFLHAVKGWFSGH